jgi:hypothetical protein
MSDEQKKRDRAPWAAFLLITHYSSLITVFVTDSRDVVETTA